MSEHKKMKGLVEKKKVKGLSTEEMKNNPSSSVAEDSEEMDRLENHESRTGGRMLEEACREDRGGGLDKYKSERQQKKSIQRQRLSFAMDRVRRSRKKRIRKWREDCWARRYSSFREYNLQPLQRMHEGSTEEEEMKQQQRMTIMKDYDQGSQCKRKNGRKQQLVG